MTDVTDKKRSSSRRWKRKVLFSTLVKAAGISRWTAYRWRQEDPEFASRWDQALENAVDVVENPLYQKAVSGDTICMIFYLKAHRPKYRDRLSVNVEQLHSEIEDRMAQLAEKCLLDKLSGSPKPQPYPLVRVRESRGSVLASYLNASVLIALPCPRLIATSDAKLSISQRRHLNPHSCERQLQRQRQN